MADLVALQQRIADLEQENRVLRDMIGNNGNNNNQNDGDRERVANIRAELQQMIDPVQLRNNFERVYRVPYGIFLKRYQSRPEPPEAKWERLKVMYVGVNFSNTDEETRQNAINRAKKLIYMHWELQRQSGTEVEVAFGDIPANAGFNAALKYEQPHLQHWLQIYENSVRDVSNAPNFNELPANGRGWKCSIIEEMNKCDFKLREGMCWLDYLERKLVGRSGFQQMTRKTLECELKAITGKISNFCNNDIIKWIKHHNYPISLYCVDPNYTIQTRYNPPQSRNMSNLKTLCYVLNNGHIYPIDNQSLFKSFANGRLKSLLNSPILSEKHNINRKANYQNFIKFTNEMDINDLIWGKIENDRDVVYYDKSQIKWHDLMTKIIEITNYAPDIIRPHNHSFIHPLSFQLYQQTEDYEQRERLSQMLFEKYNLLNFKWKNQTPTQFANLIHEIEFGFIPKSSHTELAIKLLDEYATLPLSDEVNDNVKQYKRHYDIRKCYASASVDFLRNEKLPIHTIMDNIEPYKKTNDLQCGLYLVDEFVHKSNLRVDTQWMSHFEVAKYLARGYITHKNIKLQYLSRYYINGSNIVSFIEHLFDNFDKKTANMLWHRFYGSFNTKRKRDNRAFITSDENLALSFVNKYLGEANYTEIGENTYLVERKINERIECDNVGLYTCILGAGRLKLFEMIDKFVCNDDVLLNAVRVDSIYVSSDNAHIIEFLDGVCDTHNTDDSFFASLKLFPYRREEAWNPPSKKKYLRLASVDVSNYDLSILKPKKFNKDEDYSNQSILVQGFAGSNKTGVLVNYYKKWKDNGSKCKVVAHTNVAVQHLIERGVCKKDCSTIANFLGWNGTSYKNNTIKNFDLLSIDEYSMTDVNNWIRIKRKCKQAGAKIHAFGDKWQCCAVEGEIKYDITQTQFLKELLGANGQLLIKTNEIMIDNNGKQIEPRCDDEIVSIVNGMINDEEHRLSGMLFYPSFAWIWERHPTAISNTMICKTNKMVDKLNNRLNDGIRVGCRIMINEKNDKKLDVYNCERYIVKKIDENDDLHLEEWIADPVIRHKTKKKHRIVPKSYARLSNASTCYKWQGNTLYESYIIFEPHLMNLQEFITAITRARKLSQIRITNKYQLQNKMFENVFAKNKLCEIIPKKRLKKYHLYLIVEKTTNRGYIGLTELELNERYLNHQKIDKSHCVCKDFDFKNSKIELLGDFVALSQTDNSIERAYIQDYNKFNEIEIVNFRENHYNIDILAPINNNGDSTANNYIDLSNKFTIHHYKDPKNNKKGFYYIFARNIRRKARYGGHYTQEEALKRIENVRQHLLNEHYPTTAMEEKNVD